MAIWTPIPVQNQPLLTLRNWAVIELPDETRHFVGYCLENREGRVSSEIESFAVETLTGTTGTGRIYKLFGEPGLDGDGQYVWDKWRLGYRISGFEDLTEAVWRAHLSSTTVAEAKEDTGATRDGHSSSSGLPSP